MDVQQQLQGRTIIPLTVHAIQALHHLRHMVSLSITISAFIMWSLLCAIPPRLRALSVVAVGQHSLSPIPTRPFPSSPSYYIFVILMYSLVIYVPLFFWVTYYGSIDRLEIRVPLLGPGLASGTKQMHLCFDLSSNVPTAPYTQAVSPV